ncbi:MAG: nucleoside recognition domain-containing protein [Oscillospiraceae bacterium]|nr:nucleoside recognition domain-containing protein [Oscillospiraceae bacterium]
MMNMIWLFLILVSFVCAIFTGHMEQLSQAVMEGANSGVTLVLTTAGVMCLWTGLMKIADSGGLTKRLAHLFSPILHRLFPDYPPDSPAIGAISLNVTANLLGLGNAATPFGLSAMREMQKARPDPHAKTANDSMVRFVVLNTASIQLIPTFLGAIRMQYGSSAPFGMLPAVWITSFSALVVGIAGAYLFRGKKDGERLQ